MSKQAYERETREWDDIWWEQTDDAETPRLLYIGDSISCITRRYLMAALNRAYLVDGFGTSKSIDNPYLMKALRLFAKQEPHNEIIVFNNGLHGWHLSDAEYKAHYIKTVRALKSDYPKARLFILLTTHAADEHGAGVVSRNEAASEIARQENLPVIDLYALSCEIKHMHTDNYHFSDEGYHIFAGYIAERVLSETAEVEK